MSYGARRWVSRTSLREPAAVDIQRLRCARSLRLVGASLPPVFNDVSARVAPPGRRVPAAGPREVCWDQPSALVGIDHRLLLGSTVGSYWDRPSAFAGIDRKLQGELC
jgi:hypothetical protein